VTVQPENGWFDAQAAWIGVLDDPTESAVRLFYYPGDPQATASISCPQGSVPSVEWNAFLGWYGWLHRDEIPPSGYYMAKDWQQLRFGDGASQNGEYFAKKSYERSLPGGVAGQVLTEETWFFLKHTPDASMPDCP
jgi:hypothetical protein